MCSIDLVGKTLKSRINGNIFYVDELYTENKCQYYKVCDVASGGYFAIGKEFFEIFCLQNVEVLETWKEIDGIDGYLVSDQGRIKSLNYRRTGKPQIMKLTPNERYFCVMIKGKLYFAHRLVAAAFVPNPNNYSDIKFKDGNPHNIEAKNLEWVYHNYNKKIV